MEAHFLETHEFIIRRWKDGVRENKEGDYALPFPFEPPCVNGLFQCLFYWDTYYTNKGLIIDGEIEIAKNNVDNLLYLLDRYGFVPNSNSYPGIKHNSQPPYLHFMVKDIYKATKDDNWLSHAYVILKKEYNFWMNDRMTPIGLNRYFHHPKNDNEKIDFYDYVATRLAIDKNADLNIKIHDGSNYNATCESGLDFSPRFASRCAEICPIDLNCILFAMEKNLASWANKFEPKLAKIFLNNARKRKLLINKYLLNKIDNLYYDYNYVENRIEQTEFNFTGQFFPYIVKLTSDKEGCSQILKKLEFDYGIASTSIYSSELKYQAAYPFSWPYDNGICFWALKTLKLHADCHRVGKKYLSLCANGFKKTGHLWETYDATKPFPPEEKEYPNGEMLGWTAGIYEWIFNFLNKKNK